MNKKNILRLFVIFSTISFITCSTTATFIPNLKHSTTNINQEITDVPIWTVGDEWVYDMEVDGSQESFLSFDLSIDNIKMEVTSIDQSYYTLSLLVPRGYITGSGTVDLDILQISGNLKDTRLDGYLEIKKDTLEIFYGEFSIDGYIDKLVDIPFEIAANLSFYREDFNQTNFSSIQFPLELNKQWINPFTYVVIPMEVNLLPDPAFIFTFIEEQTITCEKWDVVQTPEEEYDALKITGAMGGINWYSVAAGNTIKSNYEDIALGNDFYINTLSMDLQSTTYEIISDPPEKPAEPIGLTNATAGDIIEYETISNDPDNDLIKYVFDWGDGTISSSDFYPSDQHITLEKQWISKGTFDIKVKARDIYGAESPWSDSLQVTVQNIAPEKPIKPDGPIEGNIESSYDYITSSSDSDGHNIRYGWDWNGNQQVDEWTDYVTSGQQITTSHTWYEEGTYQIRVIAEDEYGEQSDWSEPLSVVMPKTKRPFFYTIMPQIMKNIIEKYPILLRIFI